MVLLEGMYYRCGINSFAKEQLLPELTLECLCFSLGGKGCVVCLFSSCGSRLPADLRRQFYRCSHPIVLTSLGKRNTNITISALKSEIPDHICATQGISAQTQPWCTCPQVRSGFLQSVELVPDGAVAPPDLAQRCWVALLLGIWIADGNSSCCQSQEDWERDTLLPSWPTLAFSQLLAATCCIGFLPSWSQNNSEASETVSCLLGYFPWAHLGMQRGKCQLLLNALELQSSSYISTSVEKSLAFASQTAPTWFKGCNSLKANWNWAPK